MSTQPTGKPLATTFLVADLTGRPVRLMPWSRPADSLGELRRHALGLLQGHRCTELSTDDDLRVVCADPKLALALAVRLVREVGSWCRSQLPRAGVHTASAPPTAEEHGSTGTGVAPADVAARLCAVSSGGEVLASVGTLATAGATPGLVLGPTRLHWLRGVLEPIEARPVTARP